MTPETQLANSFYTRYRVRPLDPLSIYPPNLILLDVMAFNSERRSYSTELRLRAYQLRFQATRLRRSVK